MRRKTVYICGPMTGLKCFNFKEFFYWQGVLELEGYRVLNPAEHDLEKMFDGWRYSEDQYEEVLQYDLNLIEQEADCLFVLKGWKSSSGAGREIKLATDLGLPILLQEDCTVTTKRELTK